MTLITVSQLNQSWTYGGSEAFLRIYASEPFRTSDGTFVGSGKVGTSNYAYEVTCSLAVRDRIIIPETAIHSTIDSRDCPDVTYTAVIYDEDGRERYRLSDTCSVPTGSTTWAEIVEYSHPTAPSVPTPDVQEASSTSAIVTWDASTILSGSVGGYEIRKDGRSVLDVGNVLTYTYTGLAGGETFEVRAFSTALRYSNWSTATPILVDTTPPTVPTGFTATAQSSTEILLAWEASTDDVGPDTTPPTVPTGFTATESLASITYTWEASTD
jgi:hypothetical protein